MLVPINTTAVILTSHQAEIIKASLYFDIFNYPLTREELYQNSAIHFPFKEFNSELDFLLSGNFLKEEAGYILCNQATKTNIERRLKGNQGAKSVMPLAYEYSRKIASFPFVQGVCLSGGLSKNYYDEKGDIDFFIITKPDRLWICRTLLIIRYKFLPKNKKKYWCINYLVSDKELQIPESNAFTGTELAHLIPTVNYDLYRQLLNENIWYKDRFPNKQPLEELNCINTPTSTLKLGVEKLLGGKPGWWLDNVLLYLTLKNWQKKYPHLAKEDFELQFRSRKNVCKRHTQGFQNKVLNLWEEKKNQFETTFNQKLRY